MPNIQALNELYTWIEDHGERDAEGYVHSQAMWFSRYNVHTDDNWCRTSMCAAGAITFLNGWRPFFEQEDDRTADRVYPVGTEPSYWNSRPVPTVAMEILEISPEEADFLFDGDHDRAATLRIIDNLRSGRDMHDGFRVDDYGDWMPVTSNA